jgi:hypothetical protein
MRKSVRITFDAEFSTTAIRRQSALHEAVTGNIWDALRGEAKLKNFSFVGTERRTPPGVPSLRQQSSFRADVILRYANPENPLTTRQVLVAEIGFDETYKQLERSMTVWLEDCPDIQRGLVVKIQEKPLFKNRPGKEAILKKLKEEHLGTPSDTDVRPRDPKDPYSPLTIYDYDWVGQISAFAEIWGRDPETGKPQPREKRVVSLSILCEDYSQSKMDKNT